MTLYASTLVSLLSSRESRWRCSLGYYNSAQLVLTLCVTRAVKTSCSLHDVVLCSFGKIRTLRNETSTARVRTFASWSSWKSFCTRWIRSGGCSRNLPLLFSSPCHPTNAYLYEIHLSLMNFAYDFKNRRIKLW